MGQYIELARKTAAMAEQCRQAGRDKEAEAWEEGSRVAKIADKL